MRTRKERAVAHEDRNRSEEDDSRSETEATRIVQDVLRQVEETLDIKRTVRSYARAIASAPPTQMAFSRKK